MISIIIRAKNEMPWIKHTLMMLTRQDRQDFEVIAVDSGSTDGSYECLMEFKPHVLYQIKPETYIPGRVLNEAISHAKGDIIVFNNADCIPKDSYWLKNLVKPLEADSDSSIAASFCQQIPRVNATPLVRKDYDRAFGDGRIHNTWRHFFSLASSAVPRKLIEQHPFDNEIRYSEDIEWSWRMKQLGYQISYAADAVVEHSHNYNLKGIVKRYQGEGKAELFIYRKLYEEHPEIWQRDSSLWQSVFLTAGAESLRDIAYLFKNKEYQWLILSPVFRFLQRYHAYKGRTAKQ